MNIFLGHTTACIFWLTATQEQCDQLRPSTLKPEPIKARDARSIHLALEGIFESESTLHVEIPRTHHSTQVDGIAFHTCTTLLPQAFLRFREGVYLASPEQTFIDMASILTFHELVLLGYELCSKFIRNEFSPTGTVERIPPTTPKRLKKAVESANKFHGKENALKALRFIYPGCKSPKEIETAVRFALNRQYGGDGLPPFFCNYRVDIPEALKHLTDKPFIEADFCWRKAKVAVEYDSDLHTGSEKIAKDTMRRNILVAQGYKVIGITRIQNGSRLEMDRVAEEVALALGARHDIRTQKYYTQKRILIDTLDRWLRPSPEAFFKKIRFQ